MAACETIVRSSHSRNGDTPFLDTTTHQFDSPLVKVHKYGAEIPGQRGKKYKFIKYVIDIYVLNNAGISDAYLMSVMTLDLMPHNPR